MTVSAVSIENKVQPVDQAAVDKAKNSVNDDKLRAAAQKFESVFIAQMLTHSGFANALTGSGGKGAEAFAGFYVEKIADAIADQGGFGLADQIYRQLQSADTAEREGNDRSVTL